jgi:hypothetical protein
VILDFAKRIISGDMHVWKTLKAPSGYLILEDQWSLFSELTQWTYTSSCGARQGQGPPDMVNRNAANKWQNILIKNQIHVKEINSCKEF